MAEMKETMYVVMHLQKWEEWAAKFPGGQIDVDGGNMTGFLPVYDSRVLAELDWPDHEIQTIRPVKPPVAPTPRLLGPHGE